LQQMQLPPFQYQPQAVIVTSSSLRSLDGSQALAMDSSTARPFMPADLYSPRPVLSAVGFAAQRQRSSEVQGYSPVPRQVSGDVSAIQRGLPQQQLQHQQQQHFQQQQQQHQQWQQQQLQPLQQQQFHQPSLSQPAQSQNSQQTHRPQQQQQQQQQQTHQPQPVQHQYQTITQHSQQQQAYRPQSQLQLPQQQQHKNAAGVSGVGGILPVGEMK
ncbi:unnamed protein product, partial [Polarella glacialis]